MIIRKFKNMRSLRKKKKKKDFTSRRRRVDSVESVDTTVGGDSFDLRLAEIVENIG